MNRALFILFFLNSQDFVYSQKIGIYSAKEQVCFIDNIVTKRLSLALNENKTFEYLMTEINLRKIKYGLKSDTFLLKGAYEIKNKKIKFTILEGIPPPCIKKYFMYKYVNNRLLTNKDCLVKIGDSEYYIEYLDLSYPSGDMQGR